MKVQPKPARLSSIRGLLPRLASQSSLPRVRWLSAALLLHLNVAADSPATASPAVGGAKAAASPAVGGKKAETASETQPQLGAQVRESPKVANPT